MAEKEYDIEWETMTKGDTKPAAAPAEKEDDPFEFASKEAGQNFDAPVIMPEVDKPAAATEPAKSEPVKAQTFKEAFAANRKAGAKTFEWNGKKYTTALKTEVKTKPAATPAPAVASPAAKTTPVDSTWSVAKTDNRPKVEISAPSGSMKIPAAEKSMAAPEVAADNTMYSSAGGDKLRHFGADGKPKSVATATAPKAAPVKQVASPVRTSSPMRG